MNHSLGLLNRRSRSISSGAPLGSGKPGASLSSQTGPRLYVDGARGTLNRRFSDLKNWVVLAELGHRPLGCISQLEIRAWVAAMTKAGCNAGSVKLRYQTLSTISGPLSTPPDPAISVLRGAALHGARPSGDSDA